MERAWWFLVLIATGCGRVDFDARTDGGGADVGSVDAACAWGPFSAPVKLVGPVQSPADDWFGTPALAELALFSDSYRASTRAQLWVATRATRADTFSAPSLITELDAGFDNGAPTLPGDGLEIVYDTNAAGMAKLVSASRASPTGTFSAALPLATVNGSNTVNDSNPWLSADGLRLVFSSDRSPSVGLLDLYESTRPDRTSSFGAPRALSELDSNAEDEAATLSTDGLEIFFASTRPGGLGGYDVYTARRAALDQPFSAPQLVSAVSSPMDDAGLRLSADGARLYLNYATLTSGGANSDFWIATRSCQ